jgi:CDP-glucose 4,6-dehydratase
MNNLERTYRGKKVLITGHNGFKGSWLSVWLHSMGAKVIGFSYPEYYNNCIYVNAQLKDRIQSDESGDINDIERLRQVFDTHQPEIVFHLAAQPIVRVSYDSPVETIQTNVMGTVNILECIRKTQSVNCAVIITTDKCYRDRNKKEGYREGDELGGYDPYSASKACVELIVDAYRSSYYDRTSKFVATARAGNVMGGGDFAKDRLIPDCARSLLQKKPITIRNPPHVRPWQHVLESLSGYIVLGKKLLEGKRAFADAWNFGSNSDFVFPVSQVVDLFIKYWGSGTWINTGINDNLKHETTLLLLDSTKAKNELGWTPRLDIDTTLRMTAEWYKNMNATNAFELCVQQIHYYNSLVI